MKNTGIIVCIVWQTVVSLPSLGQVSTPINIGGIREERRVDENTKVFDKRTGERISSQQYQKMIQADPGGYHLEPVFNEYGKAEIYMLRATTPQERETHHFYERDPALRPKVGEPMPEFIMTGIDDKIYRLTELKGHVVLLSFWLSIQKPFWNENQSKAFADAIRPFRSETDPVVLGVLQASKDEITGKMLTETLPFMPVPNSYGFHQKFHVTTGPTFIVIDRAGKVAAYLEGFAYEELKRVLKTVSR